MENSRIKGIKNAETWRRMQKLVQEHSRNLFNAKPTPVTVAG